MHPESLQSQVQILGVLGTPDMIWTSALLSVIPGTTFDFQLHL